MSLRRFFATACIGAVWASGSNGASAHPSAMVTGGITSQPIGHYEFCKRNSSECSIRSRNVKPLTMSNDFQERLEKLTMSVNQAVKPKSDLELYGQKEYWTYPVDEGDCEDYALAKRRALMEEGISASNLLLWMPLGLQGISEPLDM